LCGKSRPPPGFDLRIVQPVASRYTDRAIPPPEGIGKEAEMWPLMYYRKTCLKGMMRTMKDMSPGGSVCGTFQKRSSISTNSATRFTALCLMYICLFFSEIVDWQPDATVSPDRRNCWGTFDRNDRPQDDDPCHSRAIHCL
jgi:hypothetical protein